MEMSGQLHSPAALTPRQPLYRKLDVPLWPWWRRTMPGIKPQPLASHRNDEVIVFLNGRWTN